MIKANELRLGNALEYLVEDCVDNSSEWMLNIVDTADIVDAASNESIFNKYYRPIPLTPEILEKCGFRMERKQWALNVGGELFHYAFIEGFVVYAKNKNYNELTLDSVTKPNRSRFIQHLHQLQNLYFALTNEELNYTP